MNRRGFRLIILISFLIFLFLPSRRIEAKTQDIDIVEIDNYVINPVIAKFITKAIDEAAQKKSVCVIIQLDTPGGLLESTRQIVKKILNSKVPIVVYIAPSGSRAGSAGVFITYASHIASMAPSTNIGAAHPVGIGIRPLSPKRKFKEKGESEEEPDIMSEKIINDTVAWIVAIAKYRNRNVEWAKRAVTKSASITEVQALKKNVIDLVALDLDDLLLKLDGRKVQTLHGSLVLRTKGARLNHISLSGPQRILNTIAHPNVAYILMLLGIIGLIFEFSHPGIGFPGIAGLICLLLAFYSFQLLPINYTGLILIILAIVLFIAEALTPTFGILTLGGLVSLGFGSLMLIESPYPFLRISLNVIVPVMIATSAIVIFLVANALKVHRKKVITGKEALIGEVAVALTTLKPQGKVFYHGEIWNAVSLKKQRIGKNQKVKIVNIEGLKLKVEALPEET